jgi:hypothetical protein
MEKQGRAKNKGRSLREVIGFHHRAGTILTAAVEKGSQILIELTEAPERTRELKTSAQGS